MPYQKWKLFPYICGWKALRVTASNLRYLRTKDESLSDLPPTWCALSQAWSTRGQPSLSPSAQKKTPPEPYLTLRRHLPLSRTDSLATVVTRRRDQCTQGRIFTRESECSSSFLACRTMEAIHDERVVRDSIYIGKRVTTY